MPAVNNSEKSYPWVLPEADDKTAAETARAVIETLNLLKVGLSRWIGGSGYCTLLDRALVEAREQHPWLHGFPCPDGELAMVSAAAEELGNAAVTAGINSLLIHLVDLLGRIVGGEMATRLVVQACMSTSRAIVETDMEK